MCSMCNIEKHSKHFYKKCTECKNRSSIRSFNPQYDNKDKISNQRKIYH